VSPAAQCKKNGNVMGRTG